MKIDVNAYQKKKINLIVEGKCSCTGFYTQCRAWLNMLKDHTQASALSVETKELFKPNEERDIDLYTVKKIVHPHPPVYSSWGVSKLHDGLVYGKKWQIDEVVPWMAYYYEHSHGNFKKLGSPCDHLNNFGLPYSKCQFKAMSNTLMAKYWPENYGGRLIFISRTFHSIPKFLRWTKFQDHCRVLWGKEVKMDVTGQCWW